METESAPLLDLAVKKNVESKKKLRSILLMGVLMLLYSLAEVAVSLIVHSLTMFSDGLHNLSDAISLAVAYWAERSKMQGASDRMTFGWRRTELLGGISNGIFLIVIAIMITLQTVPLFIEPDDVDRDDSLSFIIVAGVGMLFNIIGVVALGGHGHSHGGGGGHGHGHGSGSSEGHGHAHGLTSRKHRSYSGQAHSINDGDCADSDDNDRHGHGHSHDDEHAHGHSHSRSHSHSQSSSADQDSHAHGHAHDDNDHGHSHGHGGIDHNMWGLFLHFAGDVFTSLLVLVVGLLVYFFKQTDHPWVVYADPVASVLSSIVIFVSAVPLVRSCGLILLQSSPSDVDVQRLSGEILQVEGIVDLHELHVWQLVDGVVIGTMHVKVISTKAWPQLMTRLQDLLHKYNIHSATIQPEYVDLTAEQVVAGTCQPYGNCVQGCIADVCCEPNGFGLRQRIVPEDSA